MAVWVLRAAFCTCTLISVATAVVRRTGNKRSSSAVHAGHRAVAVTRLQKNSHLVERQTAARFTTALRGVKGSESASEQSNSTNYSAAYTTTLKDLKGSEFVGDIGVGTKPLPRECGSLAQSDSTPSASACAVREESKLRVVFDTGSTNIWMASDLCIDGPCALKDRRRYNHTASMTYQESANPAILEIRFGTATLKGPRGVDNFHVGPFTIKNQNFNLIEEEVGYSFEKLPLEGIVGLGFPSMSARGEVPFFDNVIRQGLLEHNEFAFYVGDQEQAGGSIFWGGVDPEVYDGHITMYPVTQAHYWAIDLHELRIGDVKLDVGSGQSSVQPNTMLQQSQVTSAAEITTATRLPKLIVDTGTTYVTADPKLREEISRLLPDGECESTSNYAHIVFTVKDVSGQLHELDLSPREYMASSDGGQNCELSLMELTIPEKYGPGMVVGELFMRRYFTVFDRGTGASDDARVGFALARRGGMQ